MLKSFQKATLGALAIVSMVSLHATDWPSVNFNKENSSNNASETILGPNTVGNLSLLWSTAYLPGLVNVAPIVVDGVVYFGDTVGNLYAKDINTGADVHGPVSLGGSIDGPVTVSGDTLFATANDLKLYAFNLDLTPKVAFNGGSVVIDPESIGKAQVYSGPVVVDNIVIIPTTSNAAEIYFNMFPTVRGGISAFDATTGELLWRTRITSPDEGSSGGAWSTPSVDKDLKRIYIGTTNALSPPAGDLTAALLSLDYRTGEVVWSYQYTQNAIWGLSYPAGNDYDVGASPNLFKVQRGNGRIFKYVGVGSKAGKYRVFERDSGAPVWTARMTPKDQYISINGNPSAAYADNTIYTAANYDTSGLPINVYNMYLLMSGPAVQGQAFGQFIASFTTYDHTMIRALDEKDGTIKWSNDLVGSTLASLTHANGVLYTGNFNGVFRALKAQDGTTLYSDYIGLPISAPVTVVDGKVIVPTGIAGPGFTQTGGTIRVYSLAQ